MKALGNILSLFRKQFLDVIDWTEGGDGALSYRFPMKDREIQNGARLTVRESQLALVVNEGEVADVFEPGTHTLSTRTLPVLTSLKHWDKGFQSPFKTDVYFFSTRDQLDQRWGTPSPITFADPRLGPIQVRAHGSFSYRLRNPKTFYKKVSGTREIVKTEELQGQLRSMLLANLAGRLAGSTGGFLEMAANQLALSQGLKEALAPGFSDLGLELITLFVQNVSVPDGQLPRGASS